MPGIDEIAKERISIGVEENFRLRFGGGRASASESTLRSNFPASKFLRNRMMLSTTPVMVGEWITDRQARVCVCVCVCWAGGGQGFAQVRGLGGAGLGR